VENNDNKNEAYYSGLYSDEIQDEPKDVNSDILMVRSEKDKLEKMLKEMKWNILKQREEIYKLRLEKEEDDKYRKLFNELEGIKGRINFYQSQNAMMEQQMRKTCHDNDLLTNKLEKRIAQLENSTKYMIGNTVVSSIKKPWRAPAYFVAFIKHLNDKLRKNKNTNHSTSSLSLVDPSLIIDINTDDYFAGDLENYKLDEKEWLKELPVTRLTNLPDSISEIKIAAILDEFSYNGYKPECKLINVEPNNWCEALTHEQPHFLFVESAWQGKDGLWSKKIGYLSRELTELLEWCRDKRIPTVFWNKEDPVHFATFINTARLFDFIFTTDIDCIQKYKTALGHDRVYLLPFACQPIFNNPIEKYERKDAVNFAGAYYDRYQERQRDLATFIGKLMEFKPVEIYDRNYGGSDPNYKFPELYKPLIIGNLPFDQIDLAYKGYRYAINLNSIKQSQTMFARRIFELLASNTITVSNFSRGVRLLFGDLVIATDNGDQLLKRLQYISSDETLARKLKLASLRKVMQEHTYKDRLGYIISKVWGREYQSIPHIIVSACINNEIEFAKVLKNYRRQNYVNKELIIAVPGGYSFNIEVPEDVKVLFLDKPQDFDYGDVVKSENYIAAFIPEDYYGPNYLLDLALATRYSDAVAIGKASYYIWKSASGLKLEGDGKQYRKVDSLPVRAALVSCRMIVQRSFENWVTEQAEGEIREAGLLSADEFNYCREGGNNDSLVEMVREVDDLADLDTGVSVKTVFELAERIGCEKVSKTEKCLQISASQLSGMFDKKAGKHVSISLNGSSLNITSSLPDDKHKYIYASRDFSLEELNFKLIGKIHLDVTPGLNIQLVLLYLDQNKTRIGHAIKTARSNHQLEIPEGTRWIRFGLRIYASGEAKVKSLLLGHLSESPAVIMGHADYLVLANYYPSYEDLYRNGFVHRRIVKYKEFGMNVDVFQLHKGANIDYREFDNIDIIRGGQEALERLIEANRYKAVLVHFLDEDMWHILKLCVEHIKVLVWVHGAEIQPWQRRDFNYTTEAERDAAKKKSDRRMVFWQGVLKEAHPNLKLIFVSQYLVNSVMEDLGFNLSAGQYEIVHNFIDTNLFEYKEKSIVQRKKILSIRPYASRIYANDLSVKAILELSKKDFFCDLEFRMIGDGKLFEETLEPLRKFNNVHIDQRFLTQPEIAELHKQYGVFLCPTRMDSQGVSRDEAMSSGLVPVTNRVAAIPEFVDERCGIIADAEDALGLAEGITRLYEDPDLFQSLSKGAAQRVRGQSGMEQTINRELNLVKHW
jgi:glycosyltransferase involved in cell wall biosynthesis